MGLVWLVAGLLVIASGVAMVTSSRSVGLVGGVAVVLSQWVILSAWHDAWAGTVGNVLLLIVVAYGWFTEGPRSFRAAFERDVASGISRPIGESMVTEADLSPLPEPVRRYLRVAGVVGRPRVRNYRLRFLGRIRSGPDAEWMPFEAEQQSFADQPTRLFLMRARMFGLPVDARTARARFTNGEHTISATLLFDDDGLLVNFTGLG